MDHLADELNRCVADWNARNLPRPDVLLVAGSGLSVDLGDRVAGPLPWADLLPFPVRGIAGHPLEFDLLEPHPGRIVLYARGRLHAYQGYTPAQTVFPVRLAALLGARALVMTNSSGGLQTHQRPGDLLLIRDQLNLSGMNPLWGVFPEAWGPQFPDMGQAYDPALRARLKQHAAALDIPLAEGVYAGVAGPSYETPAEVVMLRQLGGDAVGMSTVLEVIAGHHMGLRCAVVSLISNPAAGVTDERLDHDDVLAMGRTAGGRLAQLLAALLRDPDALADG
ncbi:MAG: purine-nucleoside phosphorylase [Acidobacteriota bacterium]